MRRLQDCEIKPEGSIHVIRDDKDDEVGHLCFDTQPRKAPTEVRCAIMERDTVGREGGKRCSLLLDARRTGEAKNLRELEWVRSSRDLIIVG